MTRFKELRRIQAAIEHRNQAELQWALARIELRKRFLKRDSHRLYQLEKTVQRALDEIEGESD